MESGATATVRVATVAEREWFIPPPIFLDTGQ